MKKITKKHFEDYCTIREEVLDWTLNLVMAIQDIHSYNLDDYIDPNLFDTSHISILEERDVGISRLDGGYIIQGWSYDQYDIGFAGCFEFRVRDEWFGKTPSEIYKQIVEESRIRDLREIEQEKERLRREASRLGMMLVDIPVVDVMEELNG